MRTGLFANYEEEEKMGYRRGDVEKTKAASKKFVRYKEGAERYRYRTDEIPGARKGSRRCIQGRQDGACQL